MPDDKPKGSSRREIWSGAIGSFGLDDVLLPNGRRQELAILRHPGAAAVVPFLDRETIVLLRQYRHAAGRTLWEIPAGKLDAGEEPIRCIERELREETGYRAQTIVSIGRIHTAPAFTDEVIELFIATGLTPGAPELEDSEIIESVTLPLAVALELADGGEITDAKTVCALCRARRLLELGGVNLPFPDSGSGTKA